MSNDQLISRLKQAKAEAVEERTLRGNRALTIVLTHIDTALLWAEEDARQKESQAKIVTDAGDAVRNTPEGVVPT